MVARAKLAFQRQSVSAEQGRPRLRLNTQERRPRSLSANIPQSPTNELTEEDAFGQQLYIEAEVEVKINDEVYHSS